MAINTEITEPYAKALMSLAGEHRLADRIGEDARALRSALAESEELARFLGNPIVPNEDKKSLLRQIGGDLHEYTRNFLMLLVDRGRILFLDGICAQYLALLRERNQTVLAEVTTTVELSSDQERAVRDKVKSFTGAREVEIETRIDPDIIGGVIVKVGSKVIDASLRGQLRRLSLSLVK